MMQRTLSCDIQQGREIFSHHGVGYETPGCKDDDIQNGTLSIVVYNLGKCIEWKPNEVSVVTDTDQEWAMVETISRMRVNGDQNAAKMLPVRIPLVDLKSYKALSQKRKLLLNHKDRNTKYVFVFRYENADCFTRALRTVVRTKRSSRDRHTFNIIMEKADPEVLTHSFSELNLFTDTRKDTVWKFVNDLKSSPYVTTLSTFSKLTEYYLHRMPEQAEEHLLTSAEGPSIAQPNENLHDYHVVLKNDELPPRIFKPRGHPLSLQQWVGSFDCEGRVSNVELIKEIIFNGGVVPSLRYEVWKFLLGYYPWSSTNNERQDIRKTKSDEYFRMKLQWKSISPEQESRFSEFHDHKNLIEKDVNRTDRSIPYYFGDNNPNLTLLYDILMTYVMYNFDLGYVQGMSDLLSPILTLMTNEVDAFWCFVGFMNLVYRNFDLDQSGMKDQLSHLHTLLSFVEPTLSAFLEEKDSGNMFFCFRWLLVWFKREFNHEEIMSLWELLWTGLPCPNFHLLICVAILDKEKDILMGGNYSFTEILKHTNELAYKLDVDDVVVRATAIYDQLKHSNTLPSEARRIIGLVQFERNRISSSDDESIEDTTVSSVTSPVDDVDEKCDLAMNLNYN